MKLKIVPITFVSVLLGVVFDVLFYGKLPGVSVFLYCLSILGGLFYLANRFKARLNGAAYMLVPVILFFSSMVFVRASPLLAVLNIPITMYLLLLVVQLAMRSHVPLRDYSLAHYTGHLLGLPPRAANEAILAIKSALSDRKSDRVSSLKPVIRGILISLPVLGLLLILLSSADLVFKQIVGSLFDFSVSPELVFRAGLMLFVTGMLTGTYALIFTRSHGKLPGSRPPILRLGSTEASILLGSVTGLFLLFVLIQMAYLFGGSHNVVAGNYTYAEYARKGFFELIAVAALSMCLIWTVKRSVAVHAGPRFNGHFKWLASALITLVMIIIGSAHMRLALYEEAYGFTLSRLFAHLVIAWLAVVFALLAIHIIRQETDNKFALRVFVSTLALVAIFNIINPDALTARQNINRLNSTGKLDIAYLDHLSEDATPITGRLLDHKDEHLNKWVAGVLYKQKTRLDNQPSHWQSANLSRHKAKNFLNQKQDQLYANDYLQDTPEYDAYKKQ